MTPVELQEWLGMATNLLSEWSSGFPAAGAEGGGDQHGSGPEPAVIPSIRPRGA